MSDPTTPPGTRPAHWSTPSSSPQVCMSQTVSPQLSTDHKTWRDAGQYSYIHQVADSRSIELPFLVHAKAWTLLDTILAVAIDEGRMWNAIDIHLVPRNRKLVLADAPTSARCRSWPKCGFQNADLSEARRSNLRTL